MLWNLVDNAVKYTPAGGAVKINLEKKEAEAIVRISDTGIGIPPEDRTKIFERFYRVDKSRSRNLGGAGLGLAICQWIIELHRGAIDVQSEVAKGSTFTVSLPLAKTVAITDG